MDSKCCSGCNYANESTRYFCKQCGTFLEGNKFNDFELYKMHEIKMMRIIDNLKYVPHNKIVWDDTIDLYVSKVEKYKALYNLPEFKNENNTVIDKIDDFVNYCIKPDFQIAFVGTIKTGKSTLINALLGHNYASMDVTPETASLTKFRSSAKDYVNVTFYNDNEWEELWASRSSAADKFMEEYDRLDAESQRKKWVGHQPIYKEMKNDDIEQELQIWSSSKRAEHYFVKEVEVGISSLPDDFPSQIVFVDTPGLSDPVGYRSEITKQYIRKANAVFVCVDAKRINKEEIETISSVFSFSSHNKNKVHIIATHWDKLNDPENDWIKQKNWLLNRLHGKGFYDEVEMAEKNIIHSAAFIHNLCRDIDVIDDDDLITLMQFGLRYGLRDFERNKIKKNIMKLMEKTNIANIRNVLHDELVMNYKKILSSDIERKYIDIKFTLKRIAEENKDNLKQIIDLSAADLDKIEEAILKQKKNYEDIKACKKQLDAILTTVEKSTQKRLDRVLPQLEALANKEVRE